MTIIQSKDTEGRASWTPVPEGYTVEKAEKILRWAGHTELRDMGMVAAHTSRRPHTWHLTDTPPLSLCSMIQSTS
jgi:hypothetical protein